jgi:hypothetical protein
MIFILFSPVHLGQNYDKRLYRKNGKEMDFTVMDIELILQWEFHRHFPTVIDLNSPANGHKN